ncbi:hypothetical protein N5C56_24255 [Pseudomonas chengduensis]|nr:hypothetical protein [Pseudomonas chengduensis]MDH1283758.1 hypothetical protein [Pseudomonas chengduensis]
MQKLQSMFRNSCIAVTGLAIAGGAYAGSVLDTDTTGYLTQAQTDGETVGKLIIAAVVVLAAVGIIIGLLRKA